MKITHSNINLLNLIKLSQRSFKEFETDIISLSKEELKEYSICFNMYLVIDKIFKRLINDSNSYPDSFFEYNMVNLIKAIDLIIYSLREFPEEGKFRIHKQFFIMLNEEISIAQKQ